MTNGLIQTLVFLSLVFPFSVFATTEQTDELPNDVSFEIQKTHQVLTDQQKQELRSIFKTDEKKSPLVELLYAPQSTEDGKRKQSKIAKLDVEGLANLKTLQQNCIVQNNQREVISGGTDSSKMPKVGDVTVTKDTSSISGALCPITTSSSARTDVTIAEMSSDFSKLTFKYDIHANVERKIHAQPFIGLNNGLTSFSGSLNWKGQIKIENQFQNTKLFGGGVGEFTLQNGDQKPLILNYGMVQTIKNGVKTEKVAFSFITKFSQYSVYLQSFAETTNTESGPKTVRKFYLNGEELSLAEVEGIFGDAFDVQTGGSQIMSQN